MRQLMHRAAAAAARRWPAALALAGAALFWLSAGGAVWPLWLQLAAAGLLAACAAQLDWVQRHTGMRTWLDGYLCALRDLENLAPGAAEVAEATVIELDKRRPR